MTTRAELAARGLSAAADVARTNGLPAGDLHLISDRGSLMVHLRPAPVVARVSTMTAFTRADPAVWLAREVAVATTVARVGGPVVAPTDRADPGPHSSGGLAVSLWTFVRPDQRRPDPEQVGELLADFHAAAAGHAEPIATLSTVRDQVTEGLAALHAAQAIDGRLLTELYGVQAEVLAGIDALGGETGVLHGDAHPGNVLRGPAGWLWTDLEEACAGPLAWDLAVLRKTQQLDGERAVRRYAQVTGRSIPDGDQLEVYLRGRRLEALVWMLGMAHQDPERYLVGVPPLLAELGLDRFSTLYETVG